jgi:hypothetical protein
MTRSTYLDACRSAHAHPTMESCCGPRGRQSRLCAKRLQTFVRGLRASRRDSPEKLSSRTKTKRFGHHAHLGQPGLGARASDAIIVGLRQGGLSRRVSKVRIATKHNETGSPGYAISVSVHRLDQFFGDPRFRNCHARRFVAVFWEHRGLGSTR